MPLCPRCGHAPPTKFDNVGSTLEWFRCTSCGNLWAEDLDFTEAAKHGIAPRDATRQHILIVDDDANVLRHISRVLSVQYRVSQARDGSEALAVLRTERVDLLITDYLMPLMTGQELVEICRGEKIPCRILIITGYGDLVEKADAAWWMNHPHLLKPFHFDELRDTVRNLLAQ